MIIIVTNHLDYQYHLVKKVTKYIAELLIHAYVLALWGIHWCLLW